MKTTISRKAVEEDPGQYWNAFNHALAMSQTENLDGVFRKCHLIYGYASEAWNGGHGQYFLNKESFDHKEVLRALKELGASEHAAILEAALEVMDDFMNESVDENKSEEVSEILDSLDQKLYLTKPELFDFLESIQRKYESELVTWVE